jgi:hypothetical protein
LSELYEKLMTGLAEGKRTSLAFTCIGLGRIFGVIGSIVGTSEQSTGEGPN